MVGADEIRHTGFLDDTIGDYGTMFAVTTTASSIVSVDRHPERFSLMENTDNDEDVEDNFSGSTDEANQQVGVPAQQTFSSSSSDTPEETPRASLEKPVVLPEGISYDRDNDHQKLVAVMGREFDLPLQVAENLNEIYGRLYGQENKVKFLGYVCKRQDLLLGRIHDSDVRRHDLLVMCYNASEARIMLTGDDGFYSKLLQQVYSLLGKQTKCFLILSTCEFISGTNKAVFVIIKYHPLVVNTDMLIPESLHQRLSRQPELEECLSSRQVMSWTDKPSAVHIDRLIELAHVIGTPRQYNCTIL